MSPSRLCLIVEDQPVTRDRLVAVVGSAFGEVEIVHAGSLRESRAWLEQDTRAGGLWLCLLDLGLPDGSGISLISELRQVAPQALVVVATIYDDDVHLFEALAAGAAGYLLKDEHVAAMASYLKRIESGEPPLSPSIARRLLGHFHESRKASPEPADDVTLTGRETETLTLLARGLTIGEAAQTLTLSPQTVAGYVKVIYQKLNVSTRAQATLHAVRRGLV